MPSGCFPWSGSGTTKTTDQVPPIWHELLKCWDMRRSNTRNSFWRSKFALKNFESTWLGKSAVRGPKELFELNWLRQQRPMHFLCWRQCFLNCSSLLGVAHLKGQLRFYRKHDRRFLRGGRFSHQVWPTMGHCKAEILEFGAPGAATAIWHLGGQDQGKPRRLD